MDEHPRRPGWRKWLVALSAWAVLITAGGAGLIWQAARQQPEFYRSALEADPVAQQVAGDQLEQNVTGLHNRVQQPGPWATTITAQQINGWLAADLPEKFPDWLPREVTAPRVALAGDSVQLAFALETPSVKGVISVDAQVHLTPQPNEVAVRFLGARLGALPLPLSRVVEEISRAAEQAQAPLRWTHESHDPVAVLRLDLLENQRGEPILLKSVQILEGELRLSGVSGTDALQASADPAGRILH